jgi:hypothetical protein
MLPASLTSNALGVGVGVGLSDEAPTTAAAAAAAGLPPSDFAPVVAVPAGDDAVVTDGEEVGGGEGSAAVDAAATPGTLDTLSVFPDVVDVQNVFSYKAGRDAFLRVSGTQRGVQPTLLPCGCALLCVGW